MKVRMIASEDAPRTGATVPKRRQEITNVITGLEAGKVAVVTPETGETTRGLKASFTRAGKREDKPVKTWDIDGRVYVELSN